MPPLLIALRKDGAPTSVPPPPPDHVAPSADRPIGPGAGADLTSVRPSVHIGAAEAPAALLHVLHYTTRSLTHSLPFRVVCSIVVSQSLAFVVGLLPSLLPPPAAHVVLSSSLTPPPAPPHSRSRQWRWRHATIQLRLSFQYSAMLLDCIRPESESWCQTFPESHQHASIQAFAVHRWKRDLVTLKRA